MGQIVFNFHDVVLLMTAMLCVFFSIFIYATKKSKSDSYLCAFLLVLAFIPIHELILWGASFKITVRDNYPSLYFITGFAYYVDTVLLYFYVRSLTFEDFSLKIPDAKHLIPLLIFISYLLMYFYSLPFIERIAIINDESFVYSPTYMTIDLLCKLTRIFYCVMCIIAIQSYLNILESTQSRVEKFNITWLRFLVVGFLIVTLIEVILSSTKVFFTLTHERYWEGMGIFEMLGLTGYYTLFLFVNLLVFSSIRLFTSFSKVKLEDSAKLSNDDTNIGEQYVEQIKLDMSQEKHYLIPDITLDMLANELKIPAKNLSITLNRQFNKNFYEFINDYRIEEAKLLLAATENKDKTITEIYLEVGFNSKSVFNTFFKQVVEMTPSQFRKIPSNADTDTDGGIVFIRKED